MTGEEWLFLIFALAACGGAITVVFTENVVRMAFWLIVALGSTSGLYFATNRSCGPDVARVVSAFPPAYEAAGL